MQTETIRFYKPRERSVFIHQDGLGRDVFVHVRDISEPPIGVGEHVEFSVETSGLGQEHDRLS